MLSGKTILDLHAAGLTDAEITAFSAVVMAADLVLALEVQHSMAQAEACSAFDVIQDSILARPLQRILNKETA